MMFPRLLLGMLVTGFSCVLVSSARAKEPPAPLEAAKDYGGTDTQVFGWVTLADLEVKQLFGFTERVIGGPASSDQSQPQVKSLMTLKRGLRTAGAERIYLLANLGELFRGQALFVIPCDDPETARLLVQVFRKGESAGMEVRENLLVIATGGKQIKTSEQDKTLTKSLRAAIKAAQDAGPHGLTFAPPAAFADVVKLLISRTNGKMPTELSQSLESMSELRWLFAAGALPPSEGTLRMVFVDEEAASKFYDHLSPLMFGKDRNAPSKGLSISRDDSNIVFQTESTDAVIDVLENLRRSVLGNVPPMRVANRLKMLSLALHNYHAAYRSVPPQALTDDEGNKLLSWRVLLLPFTRELELYNQFRLDEPWDSPHNKRLIQKMPDLYVAAGQQDLPAGHTRMLAPITENSLMGRPGNPPSFRDVSDETSNTVWLLRAPKKAAVPWTKPQDWKIDDESYEQLFSDKEATVPAAFVDGSVGVLDEEVTKEIFRALITISGEEVIPEDVGR